MILCSKWKLWKVVVTDSCSPSLYQTVARVHFNITDHGPSFQEADIGGCTFSLTPERFKDFTVLTPITYKKYSFVLDTHPETSIYRFLTPLHVSTWITVFAVLLLVSSITYGITNILQKEQCPHQANTQGLVHFERMFKILCQQGKYKWEYTWM